MLTAYKVAVLMVVYGMIFYLFWIDDYRRLLTKLVDHRRDQLGHYINTTMGCIHIAMGIYIFGCVVHLVWNL
jgi:hypothetical protein